MKTRTFMIFIAFLTLLLTSFGTAMAQSSPTPGVVTFNFDAEIPGQAPAGFTSYATASGPAGKWLVQEMADAPSGKQVVVQTEADDTDNRFPVLIAEGGEYADVDVSVKGKAMAGKVDQALGLVFRFGDSRSYYVCRANALENNLRLYKLVNGRRRQFAGAEVQVAPNRWHTLRVVARGDHIVCYFNGQKLIEAQDATYAKGKVGLWTKADSVSAFDDLTISQP